MGRAAPRQAGALQVAESSCSEVCAALLVATARGTRRRVRACARRCTRPRQIERYLETVSRFRSFLPCPGGAPRSGSLRAPRA